jgi:multiple sugar transport system substrate-binding protein
MRHRLFSALILVPLTALAACGGDDGGGEGGEGGGSLTLWTTQNQPERVAIIKEITDRFTEETGITVEHSPVAEDELPGLMVANAASGDLPDVVYFPLEFAAGWSEQGLLDAEASDAVIEELGRDTFSEGALALATVEDELVAGVPADAWGQLLLYRTDLFEQAGLDVPDTYDTILAAAQALHDPGSNLYGITASTDPADVFTQQTFEHIALANDCQLVEGEEVALGSDQCVEALEFYETLINEYSPGGTQTVDTTRATYFAGQASMIVWSPFILDEMAGLRQDALPNCPQCQENPAFLAENSGIVPAFAGPSGEPAQYGQVSYFGIGGGIDNVEGAQEFLTWLLDEAYLEWLSIAPEGMIPMRAGTADDAEAFTTGWADLEIGVDEKAPFNDFYGEEVTQTLVESTDEFQRWGFTEGAGTLVTSVYDSLVVPQTLNDVLGGTSPQEAAEQLQQEVADQQSQIGG